MKKLNLKREAQDFDYPGIKKRFKQTLDFLDEVEEPVLDIGETNSFGLRLCKMLNVEYHSTEGDLNTFGWCTDEWLRFKTVFCFEILEHLKNVDMFLKHLQPCLWGKESYIYISFPRHILQQYWSDTHFHEYDEKRARTLFEEAGYEIVKMKKYWIWPEWKALFGGVRPVLRLFKFWWLFGLSRQYFYMLRLK